MKPLVTLIVVLFVSTGASAWIVPGNPDRAPSLGFHVNNTNLHGSSTLLADQGRSTFDENRTGIDLRLPVQRELTITIGYDSVSQETHFHSQDGVRFEHGTLDGSTLKFDVRVYLDK